MRPTSWLFALIFAVSGSAADFRDAVVVAPSTLSAVERKAVEAFVEEVEERTSLRWEVRPDWPAEGGSVIAIGPQSSLRDFAGSFAAELAAEGPVAGPEGFRIRVKSRAGAPVAVVVGADSRGLLYGAGKLLRSLRLQPGVAELPDD